MEENGALSPSMWVPLRFLKSGYHSGDASLHRQLAVVAPATTAITPATTSGFKLPEGWAVEKVSRSNSSRFDKYYYEPGSGQKFRSLKEVERYLTGVEYTPSHKVLKVGNHVGSSGPRKMIVSGGMNYCEPGTGRKFRSLISVERYLAEVGDNTPLSQVFKLGSHFKNSGSWKKSSREKVKTSAFDSARPPVKINWVLADPGGGTWNPFMGQSMVPESVKQQWAERFMLSIKEKNSAVPNFEY